MAAVSQRIRAHPRSRWENTNVYRLNIGCDGSSPLTWGKLAGHHDHHRIAGLIPAHVGKTVTSRCMWRRLWAHPRSRGENDVTPISATGIVGSSPLTWGKRRPALWSDAVGGLIPAHAGKTPFATRPAASNGAHPRSRGENSMPSMRRLTFSGSSPLTRGKRVRGGDGHGDRGLIPAHAGKTTWPTSGAPW